MPAPNESPDVTSLKRTVTRSTTRKAAAQQGLAARRGVVAKVVAALEEALEEITPPYLRYQIRRWLELLVLLLLTVAEVVVAQTVVQALGLTATVTDLVAVVVGVTATGLAWLLGHEWVVAHDPEAIAAGRPGWLGLAKLAIAVFLVANLAVRVYYGLLAEQVDQLGNGIVAPLLAGVLLTIVTAALMMVAAFVTAHAETAREAELRRRLRAARRELSQLDKLLGSHPGRRSRGAPVRRRGVTRSVDVEGEAGTASPSVFSGTDPGVGGRAERTPIPGRTGGRGETRRSVWPRSAIRPISRPRPRKSGGG